MDRPKPRACDGEGGGWVKAIPQWEMNTKETEDTHSKEVCRMEEGKVDGVKSKTG